MPPCLVSNGARTLYQETACTYRQSWRPTTAQSGVIFPDLSVVEEEAGLWLQNPTFLPDGSGSPGLKLPSERYRAIPLCRSYSHTNSSLARHSGTPGAGGTPSLVEEQNR